MIAGEREERADVYKAMVDFDGVIIEVDVYEFEGMALVDMGLLTGCRLSIHVTTGGEVTVERVAS